MKYKKILSVLSTFILLSAGIVYALNTEVDTGTRIVYGKYAAESDANRATEISSALADTIVTSETIIGDESLLLRARGNDLNFGESLGSVVSKLTYKNLPEILADGEVEYDDGSTEDYTQVLTFGANTIEFSSLDSEDYTEQNSTESLKQMPVPYLDLDRNLWNLVIEFDDPLDATELGDDSAIEIAGKEYRFAPDIEDTDTELILYATSRKITLESEQPQTVEIGGESFTLEIIGADDDDDGDEVFIKFNEDLKKIREGKSVAINGEKVYVNNVFARTIPEYKVTTELFIGAQELTLNTDGSLDEVEVNGKTLEGIRARVTGDVNATEKIEFQFTPTDMENIKDEFQYLEIGESVIDPLFGTISIFFDSMEEFDSESRDFIELEARGDELEFTFTNVDGDEMEFIPYYVDNLGNLQSNLVDGIIGHEDQIFILQIDTGNPEKVTEIFKIKNIGNNDVDIYSYVDDETKEYKNGDKFEGDAGMIINITGNNVTFGNQASSNVLYTENKMKITLNPSDITFDEIYIDKDESLRINSTISTINVINNTDGDIEIGSVSGQNHYDDNDIEYTLTNGFATYFVGDENELKVYVPEEETDFNLYISDAITKTTSEEIDLTIKDVDTTKTEENIIVVGGPCINNVAAQLLKGDACVGEFTAQTGVVEGQYLYQVFESPSGEGIAILIAGYNAEDTNRGVKEFLEGDFNLNIGTKLIN